MKVKDVAIVKIKIDLSEFQLPDYEYSIDQLADAADTTCEKVCESLGLDPNKVDNYETVKTDAVSKKTLNEFKQKLMEKIKDDIETLIIQYTNGDFDDTNIDSHIDELAYEVYSEYDDLSWNCSDGVKVEVVK